MQDGIKVHKSGGFTLVGDATELYRALQLRSGIKLHKSCGMMLTRGLTITKLFGMAGHYTGQKYKRGEHDRAIADLTVWIETMKSALPIESA